MFKLPGTLEKLGIGEATIAELLSFKASADKNDPTRRHDLFGPYEEYARFKTGRIPDGYYDVGDPAPWGLRVRESRSNILWQVVSGVLDRQPQFAAPYMALALDNALSDEDYAKELGKLHHDWHHYLESAGAIHDHQHNSMRHVYRSVACPACSVLTAMAVRDPVMHKIFEEMLPLKPDQRKELLRSKGLGELLNTMIPQGGAIILPDARKLF